MRTWYDPVHGRITIASKTVASDVDALVDRPEFARLRRLRQLGFASYAYPMADHSRHAHALGSAHVAGLLARTVLATVSPDDPDLAQLADEFPVLVASQRPLDALHDHAQIAALLQDLGELPFESALSGLYVPSDELREEASDWLPKAVVPNKTIFTLALLRDLSRHLPTTARLDIRLVALLICRELEWSQSDNPLLAPLRNLLESPLDADRIDYVFRDSIVTIGSIGNPRQVIDSISGYTAKSVIVSEPSHTASLLMARNHLYRSVYLNPTKRLKESALRLALEYVATNEQLQPLFASTPAPGPIGLREFVKLDDATLLAALDRVAISMHAYQVPESFARALGTIRDDSPRNYEALWVAPGEPPLTTTSVPTEILVDARGDYARAGGTPLDFFEVDSEYFASSAESQTIDNWIPELTSDPDTQANSALLAFVPTDMDARSRKQFAQARDNGSLYVVLKQRVMETEIGRPSDTTLSPGFSGPAIHISWCWSDLSTVRRVVNSLYVARVQYRLLLDPFDGLGVTPRANSQRIVDDAPSLLILASREYLGRIKDQPTGNIAQELAAVHARISRSDNFPRLVLALDDVNEVRHNFPWLQVGSVEASFLGSAVEACNRVELLSLLTNAIAHLRREPTPR